MNELDVRLTRDKNGQWTVWHGPGYGCPMELGEPEIDFIVLMSAVENAIEAMGNAELRGE